MRMALGREFEWLWGAFAVSSFGTSLAFGAFPLIAIVVLVGLGVAGVIGAAIFIKHKVHDKMAEIKARTGVDIPGMVDGARTSR